MDAEDLAAALFVRNADDNLTVAVLNPQPLGERKPAPAAPEHRH